MRRELTPEQSLSLWRARREADRSRRLARRARRRRVWVGVASAIFVAFAALYLLAHVIASFVT